jgi:hypothetical protein
MREAAALLQSPETPFKKPHRNRSVGEKEFICGGNQEPRFLPEIASFPRQADFYCALTRLPVW